MMRHLVYSVLLLVVCITAPAAATEHNLDALRHQFKQYTGAKLVFDRADLPPGQYYDVLPQLSASMKAEAATICCSEARKYPPGFFGEIGLHCVGVFAACVSKTSDGSRAYNRDLKGYRYFGIYNGVDAIAAAFYDDRQLALTFHHEIFHHVDSTHHGKTESWQLSSDDAIFYAALSGLEPHAAPAIAADDLTALRRRCRGHRLHGAVSPYASRNSREDQAETARHLMSNLPDALVQTIEQPELPGSQRILHVIREYDQSVLDGPSFGWFLDVALRRTPVAVDPLLRRLKAYANGDLAVSGGVTPDNDEVRATLQALGRLDTAQIPPQRAAEVVRLASEVTQSLLEQRIRPDKEQHRFAVWGPEDANGVNWTLRKDVTQFGIDAVRLKRIAAIDKRQSELLTRTQMKNLRLIARYYAYIASNWSVTPGTHDVFESAREKLSRSLPAAQAPLTKSLQAIELRELAWRIAEDGQLANADSVE